MNNDLQGPGDGQGVQEHGTAGLENRLPEPSSPPTSDSDVAAATAASKPQSKRSLVAVPVVALLALLGVGGWLLFGRASGGGDSGEGPKSTATPGLRRLPTESPTELYSVTIEQPGTAFYGAVGSPTRMAGRLITSDGEELRVFDSEGTELWHRSIDSDDALAMVDDDVLVGTSSGDEEGGQLTRFDGDSGDEIWSTPVGVISNSESVVVYTDSVLVLEQSSSSRSVTAYDPVTGEQLAARELVPRTGDFLPMPAVGGLVAFEDDGVYVVDERLQIVSEPIAVESMGDPSAWAYMDDEVLTVEGRTVTRYRPDGTELATAEFDVDGIKSVWGATGSAWVYLTEDGCGAMRFGGDRAETLWHLDDCPIFSNQGAVRYENADPLMFSTVPNALVINALTGETVHEGGQGSLMTPLANGFVDVGEDRTTGYAWPGGQQLFSTQRDTRRFVFIIDQGYAVFDAHGEQPVVTVYG